MVSDHLSFVYEMVYLMNETGELNDKDRRTVLRCLTTAGNILDRAEEESYLKRK